MRTCRLLLATAATVAAVSAAAPLALAGGVKNNPENNSRLGPEKNAGYFLGHPTPTYSWHGCTKTANATAVRNDFPNPDMAPGKGTAQSAVTFTKQQGAAPFISWKVKKGWKICGVQAAVTLDHPDVDSLLLAQAGYTSTKLKGSTSTATNGTESIKVKIKKGDIASSGFEQYEGKTFTIKRINAVTVFVKKK